MMRTVVDDYDALCREQRERLHLYRLPDGTIVQIAHTDDTVSCQLADGTIVTACRVQGDTK